MKKLALCFMTAFLLLAFLPAHLKAGTETSTLSVAATNTVESVQAKALLTRLDEINKMDMTVLSAAERKDLRKEVRSINSQLSDLGGGVYLSVGAIIIIVLLLILLL